MTSAIDTQTSSLIKCRLDTLHHRPESPDYTVADVRRADEAADEKVEATNI
jgi:hypothetical protein